MRHYGAFRSTRIIRSSACAGPKAAGSSGIGIRASGTIAMDELGERIVQDRSEINAKRNEARLLRDRAKQLDGEADELERFSNLARMQRLT